MSNESTKNVVCFVLNKPTKHFIVTLSLNTFPQDEGTIKKKKSKLLRAFKCTKQYTPFLFK